MQRPSPSPITTPFGQVPGYPLNNGFHKGVDFAFIPDNKVYMPEDGIVHVVPWDNHSAEGNTIYISVGNRKHALCHLSKFLVSDGQYCNAGKVIGVMGETGAAEGVHLHWAVTVGGQLVDPLTLVKGGQNVVTPDEVNRIAIAMVDRPATQEDISTFTGKSVTEVIDAYDRTDERKKIRGKVTDYDHLAETAQQQLAELQAKLDVANAHNEYEELPFKVFKQK